jgi:polar amino acid transport system substrate-binding protein
MTIATGSRREARRLFFKMTMPLMVMALVFGAYSPARAGALDDIRARGVVVIGTKGDYRPFGFRDEAGNVVGFEPDLAAEIAKALGVKLKLVPVVATNRITLLQSGDLDLVIATMNVTPERAKQVDFVEPSDKPVCTVEGSFYVSEIKDRYSPDLHLYKDTTQVYAAVKSGECFAAYDDTALIGQLQTPGWEDYEMPLRSVMLQPWGMAVKQGDTELAAFIGGLIKKWHADGHIEQLEKTWHIPPSVFAEEMHRRFADGE